MHQTVVAMPSWITVSMMIMTMSSLRGTLQSYIHIVASCQGYAPGPGHVVHMHHSIPPLKASPLFKVDPLRNSRKKRTNHKNTARKAPQRKEQHSKCPTIVTTTHTTTKNTLTHNLYHASADQAQFVAHTRVTSVRSPIPSILQP